jgi:hypothetical protein
MTICHRKGIHTVTPGVVGAGGAAVAIFEDFEQMIECEAISYKILAEVLRTGIYIV